MKPEHYQILKDAFQKLFEKNDYKTLKSQYNKKNLSDRRFWWDMYYIHIYPL